MLERIVGSTVKSGNSISVNPVTDEIAYIAGNVVVIYNPKENKQTHFLKSGSGKTIISIEFSSDGKLLAIGEKGKNPSVFIWKLTNRKKPYIIAKLSLHRYGISSISFAEGNSIILTCGDHDGIVCIWDISHCLFKKNDNTPPPELTTPISNRKSKTDISSCFYMKECQMFVTCGDSHLKSWSIDRLLNNVEERRLPRLSDAHETKDAGNSIPVQAAVLGTFRTSKFVSICSYQDNCYAISSDGILVRLNVVTSNSRRKLSVDKVINLKYPLFDISVNEKWIIVSSAHGIVRLIDRITMENLGTLPKPNELGKEAKIHSSFNNIDNNNNNPIYSDAIACSVSNSDELFIYYSDGGFISWNLTSYPTVSKNFIEYSHNHCIWDMKLVEFKNDESLSSFPSSTLITCSADDTIRFWDSKSICDPNFEPISSLHGIIHIDKDYNSLKNGVTPAKGIRCIALSPDNQHIASGDRKGNIHIHKLSSLDPVFFKEAHDAEILSLDYSKSSKHPLLLASGSRDRLIHLFNANEEQSYKHVVTLDDHSSSITSVKFANVSKNDDKNQTNLQLTSSSGDKSIIFRNIISNDNEFSFERFANAQCAGTVFDIAIDNSRQSIITSAKDKKLTRYDLKSGKQQGNPINAVKDSDDMIKLSMHSSGDFVLASSTDKCLRLYGCSIDSSYDSNDKENTNIQKSKRRTSTSTSSKCLLVAHGPSFITSACFSSCSSRIFGASADGMIFVWRLSPTLVQKLTRSLGTPSRLTPRVSIKPSPITNPRPIKVIEKEIVDKPKEIIQTWTNTEEIESSLVSELGLASAPKPDNFGFGSFFSNEDDAKVQALRRLTIEPSDEAKPIVKDSNALANALLSDPTEEDFFDFGDFSEISESSDSRLSLSRVFRESNSSPRPQKKSKFLLPSPDHSPIQISTPLNSNLPCPQSNITTPKSILKSCPIILSPDSKEMIPKNSCNIHEKINSPKIEKDVSNSTEEEDIKEENEIDNIISDECEKDESIIDTSIQETESTSNTLKEISALLGNHNQSIAETKELLSSSEEDDIDETSNENIESTDNNDIQVDEEEYDEESHSYDLQLRHQIAMNLLQNAFENAIQLYEDASFEYDSISKEETPSPYCPVYEQILDNYENVFNTLSSKLTDIPKPPSTEPQLEQYSQMLQHLSALIKGKRIVQ